VTEPAPTQNLDAAAKTAPEPRATIGSGSAQHLSQETEAVFRVAAAVAGSTGGLQPVLDTAVIAIAEALSIHAVSLRMLEVDTRSHRQRLVLKAIHNLPTGYRQRGILNLEDVGVLTEAIDGGVVFVDDLTSDPRVSHPNIAKEAAVVSMMAVGIPYQGRCLGTLQVFTDQPRTFSLFEIKLMKSIGQLLGSAIRNAQLEQHRRDHRNLERQLKLAAQVQQRLLPPLPNMPGVDLAARYVPCLDLAGDFYDFLPLNGHLGIAIGDVVGKGVPASLLMASVRASLRAYAHETYDLSEVVTKVNEALARDTRPQEFATLFYGVINPATGRLTYCNAGHEASLICRPDGSMHRLMTGGMIVGAVPDLSYEKGLFDLEPGDTMLIFTDGLSEAMNFEDRLFGRPRVAQAFQEACAEKGATAKSILNHVLWEKRRFVGLRDATDDTTLVVMRYTDQQEDPAAQI